MTKFNAQVTRQSRTFLTGVVLLYSAFATGCELSTANIETEQAYELANGAFLRRDLSQAQKLATELLAREPGFTPARILAGKIQYYNKNYEGARNFFEEAVDRDPNNSNAKVWLSRTWGLHEPARPREALELLDETLRRDGGDIEAWYLKGLLHEKTEELDQAIASYRAAANQGRRLALVHLQLALIYHKANFPEKAAAELAISAVLSGGDPELRKTIENAQDEIRRGSVKRRDESRE